MTLILTEPTGAVTHFPGGTVMIRCADYLASTRATVEVVSDADSVCGDVVHETQLVAYETINIGGGYTDYEFVDTDLADATLSIPIADLGLEAEVGYAAFIGVKIVGAGDMGHRNGEQFVTLSDQNTRIRGYNDVIDDSVYPSISPPLPRPEANPQYRIRWFQEVIWEDDPPITIPWHGFRGNLLLDPGPTDLIVAACAGEDSTYEFYLDAIYLVPFQSEANPGSNYFQTPADPTAWDPLEDPVFTGDPEPNTEHDDNEATNALNILAEGAQYSVMFAEPDGYGSGWTSPGGDYQRAKSQASFYNICNLFLWEGPPPDWPDDPLSWIAMSTSLIVVPQQTIETETFPTNHAGVTPPRTFLSESGRFYWTIVGGNSTQASVASSLLDFHNIECLVNDARVLALLGLDGRPLPTPGSPTAADFRQTLFDLSAGTIEATTQIITLPNNGTMYTWVGWESHSATDTDVDVTGVALYVESGDLKATLRSHSVYDPLFGTTRFNRANFGTSPVTVQAGYSLGDSINVKVERRYYVWRAKVWMDGDPEPGSWTLEGLQPHFWPDVSNDPTVLNVSQYPYTQGTPTQYQDGWGRRVRTYQTQFAALGVVMDPRTGTASAFGHATFSAFALSYDPVGDRDTAHIALEKYDGSVDYGFVDFDTDRIVIASLQQHTFDDDTHGFNVYLWSDSGAAELQSAVATDFIMRAPLPGPLWGDIKRP